MIVGLVYNGMRYTGFYHNSVQSKALPDIFEFLRANLLHTLEDIRLTDESQRFLVIDSQFDSGVDLSCYGEGLQRMFLLSLLFASAQHVIVLIDEFENAFHYRLIEPFSRFVHQLALKFNVQVFITSHSKECIDAFITAVPEPENLSCHAIVSTAQGIRTRDFSDPVFKKLLVENRLLGERQIELTAVVKIGIRKALAEIRRQRRGEIFDQAGTVFSLVLSALFLFHNPPVNQPIGFDHGSIHRRPRPTAGLLKDVLDVCVKGSQ